MLTLFIILLFIAMALSLLQALFGDFYKEVRYSATWVFLISSVLLLIVQILL